MPWRSPAVLLLGALLLVQIAFSIWYVAGTSSSLDDAATGPLLPEGTGDAGTIAIGDGERRVVLARDGDDWVLRSQADLPVDTDRMALLLTSLAGLRRELPVATTEQSHAQLEVSKQGFQRRLRIEYVAAESGTEADPVEFLVGSSPGYRRSHVRRSDESAVYAARLNVFDLPVEPGEWLPRDLLALDSIDRIEGPDFALRRTSGASPDASDVDPEASAADSADSDATTGAGVRTSVPPSATRWVFENDEGASVDQAAAEGLVRVFTDLDIDGLASPDAAAESPDDPLEFTVTVGDARYVYRFATEADAAWVERDDVDQRFQLNAVSAETVAAVDRVGLQVVLEPEAPTIESSNDGDSDDRSPGTGESGAGSSAVNGPADTRDGGPAARPRGSGSSVSDDVATDSGSVETLSPGEASGSVSSGDEATDSRN